jgi:hypothetical protein
VLPTGRSTHDDFDLRAPVISSFEWLSDESTHSRSFTISYTWRSPDREIRADQLAVDVSQFLGSNAEVTPTERVGDQMNKNLEKLCKQVEQIAKGLDELVSRVSQPTGLALSTTTLRNLAHVLARDGEREKVSMRRDYDVVMEVLGVDASLAFEIWKFYNGHDRRALTDVSGVSPDLDAAIERAFGPPPGDQPDE